jgi:hypothetical protein
MRDALYCNECGARLNLYVVGVCSRCHFDLTSEDPDRAAREARSTLQATESDSERTEP